MEGSWYAAKALELRTDSNQYVEVRICVHGLLCDNDGEMDPTHRDLTEWHPVARLRPTPPPTPVDFLDQLKAGSLAELWSHEGWWQVTIVQEPSPTACPLVWELSSVDFGNLQRMEAPRLRPSWQWHPERRLEHSWSMCEKASLPRGRRPAKRKHCELQPGVKEMEEEEMARRTKKLLEQFAPGSIVEVQGAEDGFFGSWYSAQVLEAKEARSIIKLRVSYQAFREEDGSTWEDWVELNQVRPLPPQHKHDFLRHLPVSAPLEVLCKEGWWEVVYSGVNGSKYKVVAPLYDVHHTVTETQLRPAWLWLADTYTWDVKLKPSASTPPARVTLPKAHKAFRAKPA
eukprot:scaffold14294_cov31-Tisochrysis_lutea.AAC.1